MNVELLAPAGSFESLKTALYFGADAVYCGGPMLQLRASGVDVDGDIYTVDQAIEHMLKIYQQ